MPARHRHVGGEPEPVEAVRRQRQHVRQIADRRKRRAAEQLERHASFEAREVELDRLRGAADVGDAKDRFVAELAQVREDLAISGTQEREPAAAERVARFPHREHALHPVQKRPGIARLRFDVDRLVAVDRIHDRRQIEPLRIGPRESGVAVRAPLHGRSHAVAVAQKDVVAHPDFVAVVDDRRARHGHEQAVHQLDRVHVVFHERRETPADAEIDARARIGGVHAIHVVAFLVRHHLERELVVVAQEDRPLAVIRNVRRLLHDLDDGIAVLLRDRHVHARHQREVIRHVALVGVAEILAHVFRPLIGFGEQELVLVVHVQRGPDLLDDRVRLGQVLVVRALALDEVGNRVQPEPVHAHVEPEAHRADHRLQHERIVEIEIGLVAEEPVPVMRVRDVIPRPVGRFRVGENDAREAVLVRIVAPHVEVALGGTRRRAPRRLKPGVLVGRMIDDQLRDHFQPRAMRFAEERAEVGTCPVHRMDVAVIGDVVTVVLERRRVEGQQPDRVHPQLADVVELRGEALEVTDAVVVRVEERLDVQLIDDRVLVPERIVCGRDPCGFVFGRGKRRNGAIHGVSSSGGGDYGSLPDREDVRHARLELHVIAWAVPGIPRVREQVVHAVTRA